MSLKCFRRLFALDWPCFKNAVVSPATPGIGKEGGGWQLLQWVRQAEVTRSRMKMWRCEGGSLLFSSKQTTPNVTTYVAWSIDQGQMETKKEEIQGS